MTSYSFQAIVLKLTRFNLHLIIKILLWDSFHFEYFFYEKKDYLLNFCFKLLNLFLFFLIITIEFFLMQEIFPVKLRPIDQKKREYFSKFHQNSAIFFLQMFALETFYTTDNI